MKRSRKIALAGAGALAIAIITGGAGCTSDADKASENIATAAEQFEVQRTIIGQSGITDDIFLYVEGRCSFEEAGDRIDITCKYGPDEYRKHTFLIGDQDRVGITQEQAIDVSVYHTRIVLKPENILPEFDIEMGEQ